MLDLLFALVLLFSLWVGAWRGLVYEVLALLSWVASFLLAQRWAVDLAQYLPLGRLSDPLRYALGFLLVFVAAVFVGGLLASLVRKMLTKIGLRPADRLLGAIFGLARGLVLLLVVTLFISLTPLRSAPWWQDAWGVGAAQHALHQLQRWLPPEFGKYLSAPA